MDVFSVEYDFQNIIQKLWIKEQQLRLGDWLVIFCLVSFTLAYLGDGKLWARPDPNAHLMYIAPQKLGELANKPKKTRDIGEKLRHDVGTCTPCLNMTEKLMKRPYRTKR